MNRKKCIFCNRNLSGERSREHIFPQWLLDHLQIRDEEISPTHYSRVTSQVVSTRHHTLDGLLAGRVCRACNNGWMDRLEAAVKENLISLIAAEKVVVDLEANERVNIARWVAKTTYLLNFASNYYKNIPIDHYHYLYSHNDSLPLGAAVFAQQHHGDSKFYWLQQAEWRFTTPNKPGKRLLRVLQTSSYKITLQFGKLLLMIAYLHDPNLRLVMWSGIHVPLWPRRGPIGWYDREDFPWDNSFEAILAFHHGLEVAHKDAFQA